MLNDGQPLRYEQKVEWNAPSLPDAASLPKFRREAAGALFTIEFRRKDAQTLERIAVAEVRQPTIASADYAAFRSAYRDWLKLLQNPLTDPS